MEESRGTIAPETKTLRRSNSSGSSSSSSSISSSSSSSNGSINDNSSMKPHALEVSEFVPIGVGGVRVSDGGSENEDGFVSGEEDFESAPDRPIVGYPEEETLGKAIEDVDVSFGDTSEFSFPVSVRPVAKVTVDGDDYEDVVGSPGVGGLVGGGVEEGLGFERKDSIGALENLGIAGGESKEKGILVEKETSENANLGELINGNGVSDTTDVETVEVFLGKYEQPENVISNEVVNGIDSEDGKAVEDLNSKVSRAKGIDVVVEGSRPVEKQEVEEQGTDLENEKALEDLKRDVLEEEKTDDSVEVVSILGDPHSSLVTESVDKGSSAETDGACFVSAKDSVVEALYLDLLKAVAATEDSETSNKEDVLVGGVELDNRFDPVSHDHEEHVASLPATNDYQIERGDLPILTEKVETVEVEFDGQTVVVSTPVMHEKILLGEEEGQKEDEKTEVLADEGENMILVEKEDGTKNEPEVKSEATVKEPGVETVVSKVEAEPLLEERTIATADIVDPALEAESEAKISGKIHEDEEDEVEEGSVTDDGETDGIVFGSTEAAKKFMEELEQGSGAESSHDHSQRIDGQIVMDSDEEVDTDEEGEDGKELFDSAALAALLKAARGGGSDGGPITITSQDGSRLFSVERPAGLGSSLPAAKQNARPIRLNNFSGFNLSKGDDTENNLSEEDKKKLENLQQLRVKFFRLVQRLGVSLEDSLAAQVLYRMSLFAGRSNNQLFNLDIAKSTANQLEEEREDDLSFSLTILVLGKSGVGKSATINSLFGEEKTRIDAFGPATTAVKEIIGTVDGVKIRVLDTPGLKTSAAEQNVNCKILSSIKKVTNKSPPDIVLYVDRLDTQTRDLNDLPLLRSISSSLGPSIWKGAIVALTHAASAPPEETSGSPVKYEMLVAQRSHVLQQAIGQAVGDLRLLNPTSMNPVSLVENHPSCRKNRDGHKVLPNGQTWRPQLLLLCYSIKILAEVSNLSKPQESLDHRKLFGFRVRSPPLPYLLSGLLQSRAHPKLASDQGGENGDSDVDLADLSDSDQEEEEDEYDQLPPFKPLKKAQIAKLSKEQRKAYIEEYDYRVKLLQKKQWREELRRMREMKKKGRAGKDRTDGHGYLGEEEDPENGTPAAVQVPLPDMALPPSFDSDNPAYRYRFLEPTSQFLARPVLDTHGWDHDCGYDGVNLEQTLALVNRFPAAITVQVTKDKKEFNIHLDSSIATKHGENGSTMAGFDIQNIGRQLAYILRGETKMKIFKRNKTAAGVSVTFLGENVCTGLKIEDQIAIGKQLILVGSTGAVRSQGDSAFGANLEVRVREADYPIGQDQSSLGLSLVKWRGDTALGANFQSQFSVGRNYKMAVRAGLNNKMSGQITVRLSSSDSLQIALLAIIPFARNIYRKIRPEVAESYSIY